MKDNYHDSGIWSRNYENIQRERDQRDSHIHHPFKNFDKSRGFHHGEMVKAAEELRNEGKGSHDPHYENSKKNK